MTKTVDDSTIYVHSTVSDQNLPLILVQYQNVEGTLTIKDARERAIALIRAVTITQIAGNLFKVLKPEKKAFGKPKKKDEEMFGAFVYFVRSARPKLNSDIEPIFGLKTQKPLINYKILNQKIQLEIESALHHAQALLVVAEAAEGDAFMYSLSDRFNISKEEIAFILKEFAKYRQINRLENLFGIN